MTAHATRAVRPFGAQTTVGSLLRRPAVAVLVVLCAYLALAALNDPRGTLGSDTGGKVATLAAMDQRGDLDPDVGYWFEAHDPEGAFHPLYFGAHIGDRWIQVTTLPALYVALPLYEAFGYRGALLVPMAGALLAATAARALARRLGDRTGDGWTAFWLVALASPIAIYALDFWEHTLGVGLLAWAVVGMLDLVHPDGSVRRPLARALGVGALIGLAATMRTEALAYGAVLTTLGCLVILRRGALAQAVRTGASVASGLAAVWLANQGLERLVLGSSLRSGRAASTAGGAGQDLALRVREAFITTFGLNAWPYPIDVIVGIVICAAAAFALWMWRRASSPGSADRSPAELRRMAFVSAGAAGALFLLALAQGLRFVPGMFLATPLAVFGLVLGGRGDARRRFVVVTALAALPVVWATQFVGGAAPQWAGRYQLLSGFLLAVAGAVVLSRAPRALRVAVIGASVLVTLLGVDLLRVRSHAVGASGLALAAQGDQVLLTRQHHIFREAGAIVGSHRWLTVDDDAELYQAVAALRQADVDELRLVDVDRASGTALPGFSATGETTTIPYLPGHVLVLSRYVAT